MSPTASDAMSASTSPTRNSTAHHLSGSSFDFLSHSTCITETTISTATQHKNHSSSATKLGNSFIIDRPRLERGTPSLEGLRSIQLSYRSVLVDTVRFELTTHST